MSNDQCAAIIQAIATATEFLYEKGISIRDRITDAESDEDAKTAEIAVFQTAIEAIISDLPDDGA